MKPILAIKQKRGSVQNFHKVQSGYGGLGDLPSKPHSKNHRALPVSPLDHYWIITGKTRIDPVMIQQCQGGSCPESRIKAKGCDARIPQPAEEARHIPL